MSAIAYLVSDYHAPSHTFVRREVEALRALGERIVPFSVRGTTPAGAEPVEQILARPFWAHLAALLSHLLRRPLQLARAWRLAIAHRPPGLRGLVWSQFHFIEAATLAALFLRAGITRCHAHFANSGAVVGLIASRIAGVPWSVTLHGISETDYPAGLLLADKLRAADFTAIASRFMMAQAMRMVEPAVWPRFHLVPCGIDPAVMPARAAKPDGGALRLVAVGRLSPEKGYGVLAEALAALAGDGRDLALDIVGDGPARSEIAAAFAGAGITTQVTFHGALPEADTLARIAAADILVLPSFMEGLPVVLMEAMAIGVPVVASRVAGIPELVEDGVSGLTVTPTDASALARAIARLADDPALAAACAASGKARVAEDFTIARNAARMRALFNGQASA